MVVLHLFRIQLSVPGRHTLIFDPVHDGSFSFPNRVLFCLFTIKPGPLSFRKVSFYVNSVLYLQVSLSRSLFLFLQGLSPMLYTFPGLHSYRKFLEFFFFSHRPPTPHSLFYLPLHRRLHPSSPDPEHLPPRGRSQCAKRNPKILYLDQGSGLLWLPLVLTYVPPVCPPTMSVGPFSNPTISTLDPSKLYVKLLFYLHSTHVYRKLLTPSPTLVLRGSQGWICRSLYHDGKWFFFFCSPPSRWRPFSPRQVKIRTTIQFPRPLCRLLTCFSILLLVLSHERTFGSLL